MQIEYERYKNHNDFIILRKNGYKMFTKLKIKVELFYNSFQQFFVI